MFFNTEPCTKETNIAAASFDDLQKLAWYDVTWNFPLLESGPHNEMWAKYNMIYDRRMNT